METENSVIVQLRVLNRRLRKAENNSSSEMQASRNSPWKIIDDDEDSPCFEEPNPEPLHRRKRIFVTGIQDRLSNADNNAFGILCLATSLFSKAAKYSLY